MALPEQNLEAPEGRADFTTTHWSVVVAAKTEFSPESASALEKLCHTYWHPLYSFVRRHGYNAEDAADLTQDFFSQLLSREGLRTVQQNKGRFRSFLLASMKNLLANNWHRGQRQKRGGGVQVFPLDHILAEERYLLIDASGNSCEDIFNRQWAETLLHRALTRLREECDGPEKLRRFDELKQFLIAGDEQPTLARAAENLNASLPAVKGMVHRMRKRFAELIREDIAQTVTTRQEIDEEIHALFAAFGK